MHGAVFRKRKKEKEKKKRRRKKEKKKKGEEEKRKRKNDAIIFPHNRVNESFSSWCLTALLVARGLPTASRL